MAEIVIGPRETLSTPDANKEIKENHSLSVTTCPETPASPDDAVIQVASVEGTIQPGFVKKLYHVSPGSDDSKHIMPNSSFLDNQGGTQGQTQANETGPIGPSTEKDGRLISDDDSHCASSLSSFGCIYKYENGAIPTTVPTSVDAESEVGWNDNEMATLAPPRSFVKFPSDVESSFRSGSYFITARKASTTEELRGAQVPVGDALRTYAMISGTNGHAAENDQDVVNLCIGGKIQDAEDSMDLSGSSPTHTIDSTSSGSFLGRGDPTQHSARRNCWKIIIYITVITVLIVIVVISSTIIVRNKHPVSIGNGESLAVTEKKRSREPIVEGPWISVKNP